MAKISAKMPIVADRVDSNGTITFDGGVPVGRLIKVTATPTQNETKLYADDGLAESASNTSSVAIALNTDTVPMAVAGKIFGATYTPPTTGQSSTPTKIEFKGSDVAPFVGFGFISGEMINNAKVYKVTHYKKVKFSLPSTEYNTQGEQIAFGTPIINGTAYPDENDSIYDEYEVATADAAVTLLSTLLDFTA